MGDNHLFLAEVIITVNVFRLIARKKIGKGGNHPMPSARKRGLKLAGAYIPDEKDEELARLAIEKGFEDKASYLRHLYDEAIKAAKAQPAKPVPTSSSNGARKKKRT